jgi:predicted type IV restriction endonuclease
MASNIKLNLPFYNSQIKVVNSKEMIFDEFRKKWIRLTPEEWVRQQLLMYLNIHLDYPKHAIAVEKSLSYNGMTRRPDAVISGRNGQILMLVECKKPGVVLDEKTFLQAATYSYVLENAYILITNGLSHFLYKLSASENKISLIQNIPDYQTLNS